MNVDWKGMTRSLMMTIRKRRMMFVGQVARKGGLGKLVLEGKINGKRQHGKRRLNSMEGKASAAGCGRVEALRRAGDRIGFRGMVATSLTGHLKKRRGS